MRLASSISRVLLFMLFFLGIANACSAAANTAGFNLSSINNGSGLELSFIALLISVDVIAIGWIANKILPSIGIAGWLPREYWEFTKSAILVTVIFSVIAFVSGLSLLLRGITPPTAGAAQTYAANANALVYQSETYLCTVDNSLQASMANVVTLSFGLGEVNGAYGAVGSFADGQGGNPGSYAGLALFYQGIPIPPVPLPGFFGLLPEFRSGINFVILSNFMLGSNFVFHSQFVSFINDALVFLAFPMALFFISEEKLLPLLVLIGLNVLIPIGLVFRSFPFLRNIGGTLVALGIGVSLIWPSLLLLINVPLTGYFKPLLYDTTSSSTAFSNSCPGFFAIICNGVNTLFTGTFYGFDSIDNIYPDINFLMKNELFIIFQQYVLFMIDLVIFFPLTDAIARTLGGTIRLQLGKRFKLV